MFDSWCWGGFGLGFEELDCLGGGGRDSIGGYWDVKYLGSKSGIGPIITFEYVIVTVSSSCRTCFVACEYHA